MAKTAENKPEVKPRKKFDLRKYVPPAFLLMLVISFSMWCLTKLSHEGYTAEVPVKVNIDGNQFRVECTAKGSGYRLLVRRTIRKSKVVLRFNDVDTTPSVINPGKYVVSPSSLQKAISERNSDIQILSIGDIPEITYNGTMR